MVRPKSLKLMNGRTSYSKEEQVAYGQFMFEEGKKIGREEERKRILDFLSQKGFRQSSYEMIELFKFLKGDKS